MFHRTSARELPVVALVTLGFLAFAPAPAEAQTDFMVYRVKFACGFVRGNVPNSDVNPLPVAYREAQPGNYSTAVNVLNPLLGSRTARVEYILVVAGLPTAFAATVNLGNLTMDTLDCDEITSGLAQVGFNNDGRFVEGFVVVMARDQTFNPPFDLDVAAVYTYASRRTNNGDTGLGASIDIEQYIGRLEQQPE